MTGVRIACLVAMLCYALLTVLVLNRGGRRKVTRYFVLYLVGMMVWQGSYVVAVFASDAEVALWAYRAMLAFSGSFGFFYAMFVRELVGLKTGKWIVPFGYAFIILCPVYVILNGPGVIDAVYRTSPGSTFLPYIEGAPVVIGATVYAVLAYSLVHLISARQASRSPDERNRLAYLTIGLVIVMVGSALNFSDNLRAYPIDIFANLANAILTAYAILRYRLLDIQFVVRKGLRYTVSTAIVTAAYFLIVFLAVQVFHMVSGYQMLLVSVVMATVAAVVVQPLRDRVQVRVDRLFFREKYDITQMLQRLSQTSASLLDIDCLTDLILAEVRSSLHFERAAIFLKDDQGEGYRLAASQGLDPTARWRLRDDHPLVAWLAEQRKVFAQQQLDRLPLARAFRLEEREQWEALQAELLIPILAKNALVGLLAVGPKLSRVAYSREDQLALLTLANQTAVAIENARLYGAVQRELAERERAEKQILESLHEKEVLLKEIHHRVKNNLQVVSSLLSLQMRYAAEERTVDVLRDSQMRIHSMALIHEKLYQSANLADVDVGEYVRSLAAHLKRTYSGGAAAEVTIAVDVPPVWLGIDAAVPCALIINELITNALKHAFQNHAGPGAISVRGCVLIDGRLELEVADNGVGIPAGISIGDPATLGMRLIRSLILQLDGDIAMSNDRGAVVRLRFPIPPPGGDEI